MQCIDQADKEDKHTQVYQMGAIYSAAQLTIVACAGHDPNYGLPGLDRGTRHFHMPYEQVGFTYVIALPTPASLAIYNSVWASRAWTYQEGYLSKRRLFFTDDQAVLICNERVFTDVLGERSEEGVSRFEETHILGSANTMFPHQGPGVSIGIHRVMDYLKTYSARALSYDSDALNAIIGILKTQSQHRRKPMQYICGIPYLAVDSPQQGVCIALSWYHTRPCRRRPDLPSWSPLAWEGSIDWLDDLPRPLVPRDCQLALQIDDRFRDIEWFAEEHHATDYPDESERGHILRVMAYTVELPQIVDNWQFDTGARTYEPCFVLAVDHATEIVVQPYWDKVMTQEDPKSSMLGLVFAHDLSVKAFYTYSPPMVMVIESHGDHYVRTGLFPRKLEAKKGLRTNERFKRTQVLPRTTSNSSTDQARERTSHTYLWLRDAKKEVILLA